MHLLYKCECTYVSTKEKENPALLTTITYVCTAASTQLTHKYTHKAEKERRSCTYIRTYVYIHTYIHIHTVQKHTENKYHRTGTSCEVRVT